jgi:hypothetical protein
MQAQLYNQPLKAFTVINPYRVPVNQGLWESWNLRDFLQWENRKELLELRKEVPPAPEVILAPGTRVTVESYLSPIELLRWKEDQRYPRTQQKFRPYDHGLRGNEEKFFKELTRDLPDPQGSRVLIPFLETNGLIDNVPKKLPLEEVHTSINSSRTISLQTRSWTLTNQDFFDDIAKSYVTVQYRKNLADFFRQMAAVYRRIYNLLPQESHPLRISGVGKNQSELRMSTLLRARPATHFQDQVLGFNLCTPAPSRKKVKSFPKTFIKLQSNPVTELWASLYSFETLFIEDILKCWGDYLSNPNPRTHEALFYA